MVKVRAVRKELWQYFYQEARGEFPCEIPGTLWREYEDAQIKLNDLEQQIAKAQIKLNDLEQQITKLFSAAVRK